MNLGNSVLSVFMLPVLVLVSPVASLAQNLQLDLADIPPGTVELSAAAAEAGTGRLAEVLLPEIANHPTFSRILPWAVTVRNVSEEPIVAVMMRYQLETTGERTKNWYFMKQNVTGPPMSDLPPGSTYVVAPGTGFSVLSSQSSAALDNPLRLGSVIRHEGDLSRQDRVVVSVDAVAFANGDFVGPDRSETYAYLSEVIRARDDLLFELSQLLAQGASEESIKTFLEPKLNRERTSWADDPYALRQSQLAFQFLGSLKWRGAAGLQPLIDARSRRIPLRRVQASN